MRRSLEFLPRRLFIIGLCLSMWLSGLTVVHAAVRFEKGMPGHCRSSNEYTISPGKVADNGQGGYGQNNRRMPPEDRARIQRNLQEWQSLPPETQQQLRRRMDQWRGLPAEDRTLYRKRFDQLQQLPPGEREGVRKKLDNWDNLSPRDKEEIRRKFPSR